jgi:hypothetical protein
VGAVPGRPGRSPPPGRGTRIASATMAAGHRGSRYPLGSSQQNRRRHRASTRRGRLPSRSSDLGMVWSPVLVSIEHSHPLDLRGRRRRRPPREHRWPYLSRASRNSERPPWWNTRPAQPSLNKERYRLLVANNVENTSMLSVQAEPSNTVSFRPHRNRLRFELLLVLLP